MSKLKTVRPRTDVPTPPNAAKPNVHHDLGRTSRETIESVVIAFVLAFLFRTFEAEAFVIPTGSMAPTLMGKHKDLACENCGYRIRAGCSEEDAVVERIGQGRVPNPSAALRDAQTVSVTCPMCRYQTDTANADKYESFNGDRIIVAKFPYAFINPQRWDIVVFKYPNDAKTNYIKRLVGLPNEIVRIFHGDIYTKPDGATEFGIERKPPEKQLAIAQKVYDNNYVVPEMTKKGWPTRWQAWPNGKSGEKTNWTATDDGKSFEITGDKSGPAWLRYQHFPPSDSDWELLEDGPISDSDKPKPQLITDFYAYNNGVARGAMNPIGPTGLHWVGDLMLSANVDVRGDKGKLILDLVEGGVHFSATIDVASGEATLSHDGSPKFKRKASTSVKGPGNYRLVFSNFDDQLTLWVDGSVVHFQESTAYDPLDNDVPKSTEEDPGDLAPAGIGVEGGLAVKVSDLLLERDIYYIADKYGTSAMGQLSDYDYGPGLPPPLAQDPPKFFASPDAWRQGVRGAGNVFELRREVTFPLAADQYFVLGDNSPSSKDSRLWENDQHYVGREMMIGKALFIYWPHSFYHIPKIGMPYVPNFRDMGFVR